MTMMDEIQKFAQDFIDESKKKINVNILANGLNEMKCCDTNQYDNLWHLPADEMVRAIDKQEEVIEKVIKATGLSYDEVDSLYEKLNEFLLSRNIDE